MRKFISVLAVCTALTGISSPQSNAETERQLLTTLHQMYAADKKHDFKFLRSYLSDDFTEVAGDGHVYHLEDVESGMSDMELLEYKLSDCVSRLITSESAYMSCRMDVHAKFKGKALPQLFRVTWVRTQAKGQWSLRFEQATIIVGETSRADR